VRDVATRARTSASAATVASLPAPGEYLCGLTWDGVHLWHSDQGARKIFALDRATGSVVREFRCGYVRADLAYDGSVLCQVGGRPKRLVLVDRRTGAIIGRREVLPASGRLTGIELGTEGLWLCLRAPTVVQLRDYPAMTVRVEYPVRGGGPAGLTYANGVVVYGEYEAGRLHAIDAATGAHLASARVVGRPTGLTWDGERLWYSDFPNRRLRAINLGDVLA
jgi:outer membrane protein assembly factor BamB